MVLRRLELLTKDEGQSLPQIANLADRLLALAQLRDDTPPSFDLYMRHQAAFDAHATGAPSPPPSPKKSKGGRPSKAAKSGAMARSAGRLGGVPAGDATISAAEIEAASADALFAARLCGCLASLLRIQTAQLVLLAERVLKDMHAQVMLLMTT